jgi:triphosphoribosyl-dephospho-CoA synthase
VPDAIDARIAGARAAFQRACALDVAVRKPGNVSAASPGHRMHAGLFLVSAEAAAGPLFTRGRPVGERIECATEATWAAAGCNTNLGIVLLCAPLAASIESDAPLKTALNDVLAGLDIADATAAYRAIARANPGGLGRAEVHDVADVPSIDLRRAMGLAAPRDSIARQYTNGYADLFDLPAGLLSPLPDNGLFDRTPDATTIDRVQRVYLEFLAGWPDSHIVRKHGEGPAQTVMSAAQGWRARSQLDADPAFAAWDESLKAAGLNPGTSADLTVAALLLAQLQDRIHERWHGS